MAADDRAIVVGINAYPGLSEAVGAEADACAFRDWLIDPNGGDLVPDDDHVSLIVTSAFGPPPRNPRNALPTVMQIWQAAQDLLDRGPGRVGRRLYLYFAGHGIAPHESETALLMANAKKGAMGSLFHWMGEYTAEHFRQSGLFDEIVLLMDCCREAVPMDAPNRPWGVLRAEGFTHNVKRCYAYATRWQDVAWARPMAAGGVGGEFTTALLNGLRGAAYEPHSGGRITTGSLKRYLLDSLPRLQDSDFRDDDFVVASVEPVECPVVIHLPEQTAGMQAQVRVSRAGGIHVLQESIATPPTWKVALDKGSYEVQVLAAGLQQSFVVDGTGGTDVQL